MAPVFLNFGIAPCKQKKCRLASLPEDDETDDVEAKLEGKAGNGLRRGRDESKSEHEGMRLSDHVNSLRRGSASGSGTGSGSRGSRLDMIAEEARGQDVDKESDGWWKSEFGINQSR